MNRRGFFSALIGGLAAPFSADDNHDIKGVGVLRFPALYESAGKLARTIAGNIKSGSVLALPNTRDDTGEYEWDYRIVGGDPSQVTVERAGDGNG